MNLHSLVATKKVLLSTGRNWTVTPFLQNDGEGKEEGVKEKERGENKRKHCGEWNKEYQLNGDHHKMVMVTRMCSVKVGSYLAFVANA